ncbi:MAG: SulP family inorganic anion transporter [Parvibaculum sp.]|uniref:SulP family inorganic anion transporter n=1 Tax=Parvibaculum sp. TaxID=2024848 RepID=UPI00284D4282|nr:SulP family inorganic anion transporter [Parvibaculum sp.]MDR3497966.1 SulP family inorganic anion transporter [Parvibaculum sp.]
MSLATADKASRFALFTPKLVTVLREGYGPRDFRQDFIAGLTVAIVALPLSMALAIASGATPDKGLLTAVVAGFLISALGGTRFQIGGPTGAFVVVVFNVIAQHGFDGLVLATLMAGVMLVAAGFFQIGTYIKYIPQPVITGFTSGIAVIIASSQIKDFFGLTLDKVPADFIPKIEALAKALPTTSPATLAVAAGSLAVIVVLRRFRPSWPGFLIAVVLASAAVWAFHIDTATIGTRFVGLKPHFELPPLPSVSYERLRDLFPSAFTIAFLAGVESLLSALVADSMTGNRHRSNCELVAQGVANCASALVGGLPATGAIARTATNIRSGARGPIAGMLHAVFILIFLLVAWPLTGFIPLAALAAVLAIVAWNMSEVERFRHLMKAPFGDRAVLLVTFGLTVIVDLTVAIEVGVVLAAVLLMHRLSEAVEVQANIKLIDEDIADDAPQDSRPVTQSELPPGVIASVIRGPFFFGVAMRLGETLDRIGKPPRVFILRMRAVPLIDGTGATAIQSLIARCHKHGTTVIMTALHAQPRQVLQDMGILDSGIILVPGIDAALAEARKIVGASA